MTAELLFAVDGSRATPGRAVDLSSAGLRERDDLQEWVLAHPEILGPSVKIVAFEFDRWAGSSTGTRERDRLDVLGLDGDGRLVVAELKRDRAPETVNLQAIKYAAMTSRFTEETLTEHYRAFRARAGEVLSAEEALAELTAHAAGELDPEILRAPRIVLVAGSFPPTVTATAVWLTEMGLDLTLQRIQAYSVFDDRVVVTVSQVFPVVDVEEFTVSPQRVEAKKTAERRRGTRERSTVVRLIDAGTIPDGTVLHLRPTNEVTSEVRDTLMRWVGEDPRRGRATWNNQRNAPLTWHYDKRAARPSPLVSHMLAEAAQVERSPRGPAWWVMDDGRDLAAVASTAAVGSTTFDWSVLHDMLERLPRERWTTYGDLAGVIGTAAQPLGQHISRCSSCSNAHRVLNRDGTVNVSFAWSDPDDDRRPEDALVADGIRIRDGRADPEQRLTAEDLSDLRE